MFSCWTNGIIFVADELHIVAKKKTSFKKNTVVKFKDFEKSILQSYWSLLKRLGKIENSFKTIFFS